MTRHRKFSLITLAFVFIAALFSAATLLLGGASFADADRNINLTGSNYFYVANQAAVTEQQVGSSYYTAFSFADDDSAVTYRKNLAYHWFSGERDSQGNLTGNREGFLSTEFGFEDVGFETFTVRFQSQQYTQTEDGVTSNYVTLIAADEEGMVYAKMGEPLPEEADARAAEITSIKESGTALDASRLTFEFTGYNEGAYSVSLSDAENNTVTGTFANVGGSYANYVSSTSSSVIPVTYSAQGGAATMALYSFNEQSFELSGEEGARIVKDDTPPVVCLSGDLTTLSYGRSIDIDYTVIDMLATSPRSTLNYYVLKKSYVEGGDLNNTEDGHFTSVSGSEASPVIRGDDPYEPENKEGADFTAQCLVKVYLSVQDSTATGNTSDEVFLEWYVPEEFRYTVEGGDGQSYDFIMATTDAKGVGYAESEVNELSYQDLVDEALTEQSATAGDGNYFYLPSYEGFVSDNVTSYRDLSFSVYYISRETEVSSSTNLSYNELSIELQYDGLYRFVIYVTDAAGNDMYYIDRDDEGNIIYDENNQPVLVEFTTDDLSSFLEDSINSDLNGKIPVYEFSVNYAGLSVTAPKGQEIGFVGTEYSAPDFDITGLSDKYSTSYTLYLFNRGAYFEDTQERLTYSDFISRAEELFTSPDTREYFESIPALDSLEETDADYERYSEYEWDPDSLDFVPQDDNAFYVIRMEAVDNVYQTTALTSYMAISASAAAEPLYGESDWLQNNVASVVLLCVAGAALIGIILLVVIKPKDKGDIDQIDDKAVKRVSARKKINKK